MNSPTVILQYLLIPVLVIFVLTLTALHVLDLVRRGRNTQPITRACRCGHIRTVHEHHTRRRDTRCALCTCFEYIQRDVARVRDLAPTALDTETTR